MSLFEGFRQDDPLRILVPVGVPCVLLLVLGSIFPAVVIVVIALGVSAAAIAIACLLFRFVQKFLNENRGPGGTLDTWRPTVLSGLRSGCWVLLQWAPFGFLALLVFGANGLIMLGIEWFLELGIGKLSHGTGVLAEETASLSGGWLGLLPGVEEALQGTATELKGLTRALYNLLVVLKFIFVVETYVSWIFLAWLTTRSVLYFLSRRVLVEQGLAPDVESSSIEIRFDMEFTR
jgi:hypothetical protein